jgi:hypothetical protein
MGIRIWIKEVWSSFWRTMLVIILILSMGGSTLSAFNSRDRIRRFADPYTFDFLGWTLAAVVDEAAQWGLGSSRYLEPVNEIMVVREYLQLVELIQQKRAELENAYGDPDQVQSATEIARLTSELDELSMRLDGLRPLAEDILEGQVATVLEQLELGSEPFVFPPVAFQFARLPSSLIVSPRDVIRQDANISLRVDMSLEQVVALEQQVEEYENVSSLVVPVGGLGTYPTMILETTSLTWITEVIAHEWVHNYLSFRPLGFNYSTSPEIRTMNETTASLIGEAVGREVLKLYYPELLPPPEPAPAAPEASPAPVPVFDFRAEMRATRLRVDELLAQGSVEAAESYMDERRLFFRENGYPLRRLNQAYFAFHGAYADEPGGAAGDDPVGEAVRTLWKQSASPAAFLQRMARMNSFDDLLEAISIPAG